MSGGFLRRNLWEIQQEYDAGKAPGTAQLENLALGFQGIKQLPYDDPNSFFTLAGYHGMPFKGGGIKDPAYWGGYCHHGNILFPTWHRAYLLAFERALRSIPGCETVALPYLDESADKTAQNGLPSCLTNPTFEFKSQSRPAIPNPFLNFTIPIKMHDQVVTNEKTNFQLLNVASKPAGHVTERFPRASLVGTEADLAETTANHLQYPDPAINVQLLNDNIKNAVTLPKAGLQALIKQAMENPFYTTFSNETSTGSFNDQQQPVPIPDPKQPINPVFSLESAHDVFHAAIGGIAFTNDGAKPLAYSEMASPEVAGFDPIFFFHHCYIDYAFWKWQQKHNKTQQLDIDPSLEGTTAQYFFGVAVGHTDNEFLDLDTKLEPFKKTDGTYYFSRDLIDITKVGYDYDTTGSLEVFLSPPPPQGLYVDIKGLDRSVVAGSFCIIVNAVKDGTRVPVGARVFFNRFKAAACMNCLNHLEVKAAIPLVGLDNKSDDIPIIEVQILSKNVNVVFNSGDLNLPEGFEKFRFQVRRYATLTTLPTPPTNPIPGLGHHHHPPPHFPGLGGLPH